MNKYSYLNLNQKMIKIRKKLPALMRKRYSEDVDYDFVKLDDINQFLTPALNKYGVDFDMKREIATQRDSLGNPIFLTQDGNLWRYEADLEICWTNADRPEEVISATIHLVGTNDVPDKAKGTAMTYGLKYYLLNKFNFAQNGDEDPDMRGIKPVKETPKEKAAEDKKESKKSEAIKMDTGKVDTKKADRSEADKVWITKIDVKNKGTSEKLCNNTGNAGKPRKIKGKHELGERNPPKFDSYFENGKNCIVNLMKITYKKGKTAGNA